jgi:acyl carrier protein
MNENDSIDARIRAVLAQHGRLAQRPEALAESADLYQAGLTSHASVNVMLALESAFDIEFPDQMLTRSVFSSIGAIRSALTQLIPA